ncbi:integrase core domain-containing protein [Euzebyella marina]|uniref:integrase core domain-containing protein n=1 Tax=Euzebyella marina TaxID=1761453 RepID=UPI0013CE9195|nr:integrase core domain-containing protein [Euzebyella marina]
MVTTLHGWVHGTNAGALGKTKNYGATDIQLGRATDNAFIERLWRNVKYEKIYLNPTMDRMDLYLLLTEYFDYYNYERRHQSIYYERPIDIFERAA